MSPEIIAELAPTGVLRAGINLANFLLVTGKGRRAIPRAWRPIWRRRSRGGWRSK